MIVSPCCLRKAGFEQAKKADPNAVFSDIFKNRLTGLAKNMSYCGLEQHFLSSIRFQVHGSRLLALARPSEVTRH